MGRIYDILVSSFFFVFDAIFSISLALPVVSHRFSFLLPICLRILGFHTGLGWLKHQNLPELVLKNPVCLSGFGWWLLWLCLSALSSPCTNTLQAGDDETLGRKSTEPMSLSWAARTRPLIFSWGGEWLWNLGHDSLILFLWIGANQAHQGFPNYPDPPWWNMGQYTDTIWYPDLGLPIVMATNGGSIPWWMKIEWKEETRWWMGLEHIFGTLGLSTICLGWWNYS